jgi:hypothetical protein
VAADLLHVIVTNPDNIGTPPDPEAARHLAVFYAKGLGVPRDPIAACALAETANMLRWQAFEVRTNDVIQMEVAEDLRTSTPVSL